MVLGLGFKVRFSSRVSGVEYSGFRAWGSGFKVWGAGFRDWGSSSRVESFAVWCSQVEGVGGVGSEAVDGLRERKRETTGNEPLAPNT